jgi:maleate cis-trans isomerase
VAFTSWRGVVGNIKPTMRPGSVEELCRILPEGIGIIPLFLDIQRGAREDFTTILKSYEPMIAKLAEHEVDLIHPEGAPPFMVLGYQGEAELLKKWEKTYRTPMFTSGTNHIRALNALKVKRFVGASYFSGSINQTFGKYFVDAGFDVLAMEGIEVPFKDVGNLSPEQVYKHVKKVFLKHRKEAEGIYLLGSGWRVMGIIDLLERDLGVPVIHPVPTRCWEIQRRLTINHPVSGYGRLLAEMIPG